MEEARFDVDPIMAGQETWLSAAELPVLGRLERGRAVPQKRRSISILFKAVEQEPHRTCFCRVGARTRLVIRNVKYAPCTDRMHALGIHTTKGPAALPPTIKRMERIEERG